MKVELNYSELFELIYAVSIASEHTMKIHDIMDSPELKQSYIDENQALKQLNEKLMSYYKV